METWRKIRRITRQEIPIYHTYTHTDLDNERTSLVELQGPVEAHSGQRDPEIFFIALSIFGLEEMQIGESSARHFAVAAQLHVLLDDAPFRVGDRLTGSAQVEEGEFASEVGEGKGFKRE